MLFIDEYFIVGDVNEVLMCVVDVVVRSSDVDAARDVVAKALVNFVIDMFMLKVVSVVGKFFVVFYNCGGFVIVVVE